LQLDEKKLWHHKDLSEFSSKSMTGREQVKLKMNDVLVVILHLF